jgi:hypothetical protein
MSRLFQELADISRNPPPGCSAGPLNDDSKYPLDRFNFGNIFSSCVLSPDQTKHYITGVCCFSTNNKYVTRSYGYTSDINSKIIQPEHVIRCILCVLNGWFSSTSTKLLLNSFMTVRLSITTCLHIDCFMTVRLSITTCLHIDCFMTVRLSITTCLHIDCFMTVRLSITTCLHIDCFMTVRLSIMTCLHIDCFMTVRLSIMTCLHIDCFMTIRLSITTCLHIDCCLSQPTLLHRRLEMIPCFCFEFLIFISCVLVSLLSWPFHPCLYKYNFICFV